METNALFAAALGRRIGIDETSSRRGHNHISLFVDLDGGQLLFATPGKDAATVTRFKEYRVAHGRQPDQIEEACCDMSAAFLKGLDAEFPDTRAFHLKLAFLVVFTPPKRVAAGYLDRGVAVQLGAGCRRWCVWRGRCGNIGTAFSAGSRPISRTGCRRGSTA
jgi:hypothetical protein